MLLSQLESKHIPGSLKTRVYRLSMILLCAFQCSGQQQTLIEPKKFINKLTIKLWQQTKAMALMASLVPAQIEC